MSMTFDDVIWDIYDVIRDNFPQNQTLGQLTRLNFRVLMFQRLSIIRVE